MDTVTIKNLRVFSNHGVFPAENELGQEFFISAILSLDLSKAAETDDILEAVDYSEVAKLIYKITSENTFKLIETLCYRIADEIIITYPSVKSVSVKVDKPHAPINLCFDNISVTVERKWYRVYLSVGSNMGDRKAYLDNAYRCLKEEKKIKDIRLSETIETKPYGYENQDNFLNNVIELKTILNPHELLKLINHIEDLNGRKRTIRWGPRTLDIDIVLYDDIILYDDDLIIPHVDMINREFVLKPLLSLNPYLIHPVYKKSIKNIYEDLI